jgi:hypothetical protein
MNTRKRIALVLSATALTVGAGTGVAVGAKSDAGPPGGGAPPGAVAIASYLGITGDQIRADRRSGETLAELATAQGKTVSGLEAAILADAKTHLDAEVAAGTLTATQESSILTDLSSHLDSMVNSTGPPAAGMGGPGGGPASPAIAAYLGLTADQVRTQLQVGQTLAEIATAQGKTAAGLEAAILADATTHLDAEVAAGTISAAQESSIRTDLSSHLDAMVNSTGPPERDAGGPGGPGSTFRLAG